MIFLTGATGHTGSRVARRLVERGESIRCLLHMPSHASFLPKQAEVVQGNVIDIEKVAQAMHGASACIHLAHIRYAQSILNACRLTGVSRFLCLSSTRRFTRFPCETSRAVIEGEAHVEESGLDWTILRPSMIYGGPRDNNIERLKTYFQKTPFFPLVRGGMQLVQPVFTWDVVDALEAALGRPQSIGHAYTLAGPEPFTYRHMVESAAALVRRKPVFIPMPFELAMAGAWLIEHSFPKPLATPEMVRRFLEDKVFDIKPAQADLGFAPVSFTEGMARKKYGAV